MKKRPCVAVQMDPFEKLLPEVDTTLVIMRAAAARGYELFVYTPDMLRWQHDDRSGGRVAARGAMVTGWDEGALLPRLGALREMDLAACRAVLVRQDPPFDMAYVTAGYLLELLPPEVLVVNQPRAVRDAPEKIFITRHAAITPPTLIGADVAAVEAFRALHGALVLKPLYGFGGADIRLLETTDGREVIEAYRRKLGGAFVAQKFLPAVKEGDKRVTLIDGRVASVVNRVPQGAQFLANTHAGGRGEAAAVTAQDEALLARFAGGLARMGILHAGVDIIGGMVTEINVTCPGGMAEVNRIYALEGKARVEEKYWDMIEQRMGTPA